MALDNRGYAGRIAYLKQDGDTWQEWGCETFTATVHAKGRTIRALCEMDEAKLHRDVNWSVDADWVPQDGFVRVTRDNVTVGTSWYKIEGTVAQCEGVTETHGRVSRTVTADRPIQFLGTHPLTGDSTIAAARDKGNPGVEEPIMSAVNSLAFLGDEGLDVQLLEPLVAYIGPEELTVTAGTFAAEHYTIRWSETVPMITDFWVTEGDYLPLLSLIEDQRYELMTLDQF